MAPRRKTRMIEVESRSLGPTPERMSKSDADSVIIGGNDASGKVYQFADALLERVKKRGVLSNRQYAALNKFRHHWHHAGLEPSVGSVDLNRVFAPDFTNFSGMAKSETQAFHRQQYRNSVNKMGMILSRSIERIVCEDHAIESYGRAELGWSHPLQARSSATEHLRIAGDLLGDMWKIPYFDDERD